jgi:hypothetical protein
LSFGNSLASTCSGCCFMELVRSCQD